MNSIDVGSIRAKLELDAKNYSQSIEKAKGKTKELESSAKDTESSIKKLGVAFAGLTLAMGGVITASVKTAAQFESSMARVKAITQANVMEFDALRKKAEELGASTVFSASQTAEGMSYLAMAGFNVQEIISAMPGVLNLAAAGQMELARTADIASNILTGFKIEAGETSRVVDVLAKTMTSSNTNIEQLGYAMKYVAPIASNAGLSLEETAAAVGKLSDAGIQGEMAGTTLRAILLRLISPSAEAAKLMNELGFSITDANGKMLELPQIISNAERAFSGLTETQRLEYAATIAGTEAASGFLTLLSTEESTLAEFTSQLQDSAGAAQEMADIQNNTLNGSIAAFKSALEAAGIAVGDKFAPAIREVTSILTSLAKGFADLNTPAQNAIITFSMLVPLVGSLVFGIRALSTALMALKLTIPVFAAISLAVGGLAAGLSYLSSKQREVEEQERKTREETNRLSKEYDDLARKTSDLADDSQEAIDAKKRMAEVFERIKEINPDVVSAYNSQTSAIRSMTGATREATKAKIDDLKATLALLKAQDAQGDGGSIGLGKSLGIAKAIAEIEKLERELRGMGNPKSSNLPFYLTDDDRKWSGGNGGGGSSNVQTNVKSSSSGGGGSGSKSASSSSKGGGSSKSSSSKKSFEDVQAEQYRESLKWIQYKKELDKMSEEEELAALNRLLERYKNNAEIRKDLEVKVHRLKSQMAEDSVREAEKSARESYTNSSEWIEREERRMREKGAAEEEITQMRLDAWLRVRNRHEADSDYYKRADREVAENKKRLIEMATAKRMEALSKERDMQKESLRESLKNEEEAYKNRIETTKQRYDESVKAIRRQVEAIDAQIKAERELEKVEDRRLQRAELIAKKNAIIADKRFEKVVRNKDGTLTTELTHDAEAVASIDKQLADMDRQAARERREAELDARKRQLNEQIDVINMAKEAEIKSLQDGLAAMQDGNRKKIEALDVYWADVLDRDKIAQDMRNTVLQQGLDTALSSVEKHLDSVMSAYQSRISDMIALGAQLSGGLGGSVTHNDNSMSIGSVNVTANSADAIIGSIQRFKQISKG